jgi:hypothetical protein
MLINANEAEAVSAKTQRHKDKLIQKPGIQEKNIKSLIS